jgi:AcrR family transcriptional regulator
MEITAQGSLSMLSQSAPLTVNPESFNVSAKRPVGRNGPGGLEKTMRERRRMQPDMRRKQIIDTAVHLYFTMGYEAASLRDLAERVGINKATIYHYFTSKEEILYEIVEHVGRELLDGLTEARGSAGDPLAGLEAMIRFQIGYMEGHFEEIKVLVEEQKSLKNDAADRTKVLQAEILKLYKQTLSECMDAGLVRRLHLPTAAFAILSQINWLYYWYQPHGPLSIRELTDEVLTILSNGLFLAPKKEEGAEGR